MASNFSRRRGGNALAPPRLRGVGIERGDFGGREGAALPRVRREDGLDRRGAVAGASVGEARLCDEAAQQRQQGDPLLVERARGGAATAPRKN